MDIFSIFQYFWKQLIFLPHQKNKTKVENISLLLCAEFIADSKNVLVFLLALIVFDLFSFEGPKTHFTGEANIYTCIY